MGKKRKDLHRPPTPNPGEEGSRGPTSPKRASKKQRKRDREQIRLSPPIVSIEKELELGRGQPVPTTTEPATASTSKIATPMASQIPTPTENMDVEMNNLQLKDKGKQKEVLPSEDESSSSEEDAVIFKTVAMDRVNVYGPKIEHNLITKFTDPPEINFHDYMAPFRGLLSEMRNESEETKNAALAEYFTKPAKRKILVATSGKKSKRI